MRPTNLVALIVGGLVAAACGEIAIASSSGQDDIQQAPPAPPAASIPNAHWTNLTDTKFHFEISYPSNFVLQKGAAMPGTGLLMTYRAVDPAFLNGYPPGQIEMAIYKFDASSLTDWIQAHSGPPASQSLLRYWSPPSIQGTASIAGKPALVFDWTPDMGGPPIHATAVLMRNHQVFVLQWWSDDPTYAPVLQTYRSHMQSDFRDDSQA